MIKEHICKINDTEGETIKLYIRKMQYKLKDGHRTEATGHFVGIECGEDSIELKVPAHKLDEFSSYLANISEQE